MTCWKGFVTLQDVTYGTAGGATLKADITKPGVLPAPVVIYIHGGGYFQGDENMNANIQRDIASAGFICASINYRLAKPLGQLPGQTTTGNYPQQTDDVHTAVTWARTLADSTGKVGAIGTSAGATHAVQCAITGTAGANRLDVAAGFSGTYDLTLFNAAEPRVEQEIENYVGSTVTAVLQAASVLTQVDATAKPLALIGSDAEIIPIANLTSLTARLTALGLSNYISSIRPGTNHGASNWDYASKPVLDFLHTYLNV